MNILVVVDHSISIEFMTIEGNVGVNELVMNGICAKLWADGGSLVRG